MDSSPNWDWVEFYLRTGARHEENSFREYGPRWVGILAFNGRECGEDSAKRA
jgi:hypothetical protein